MTSSNGKSGNFISRLFHHNKKSEEKATTTPTAPATSAETAKPAETTTMAKSTLYVFGGSVWASAPGLTLMELKYTPDNVEEKIVNLLEGDNFEPEFLRIECVEWLVLHAPTPGVKSAHQNAITAVHRENVDPNFSLLSARTPEELKAKRESVPGLLARQRQAKLEKLAPESPEDLKEFYKEKLASSGFLSSVYAEESSAEVTSGWFDKSNQHWSDVKAFVSTELPSLLPDSGFVDGAAPGEADFHVAAWLARTAGVCGAKPDDVTPLGEALGLTLDPKLVAYFDAWKVRDSWKKMYAEGLH
ncbi:hypothetical protein FRC10_003584 [Ceratobasidium sp. 414]|nr:hypothetical protein FRC10_003584 [Ceratobasidium sp. 414]